MSDTTDASTSRRRWIVIGSIAAAIVIVAAIVALALAPRDSTPAGAGASPSTSPSRTASATPTPDTTPSESAPSDASGPSTGEDGRQTEAPVPIDSPASPEAGVTVRLANIEAVAGEGAGPGESSGPAIRVTVEVTNSGAAELSLATAVVNAYYGDGVPANPLSRPGGAPFPASVPPGGTGSGVFLFVVPTDQRGAVTVSVDLALRAPIVVFQGPVP